MVDLAIWTLGTPSIEYQGSAIKVDTRKAIALVVYLAIESQPRSRDAMAALLWPEHDQTRARAALRRTLSVLNKALGGHYLAIERERLALVGPEEPWIDAREFRRLLALRRTHDHPEKEVCAACLEPLQQAVTLYRDDFLTGFTLRDSVNFEEWQLEQRQNLRDELGTALAALTRAYILVGELTEALTTARRWLALDPLNEQSSRFLMRLYDWTGQRAAALRQYDVCAQTLERELGAVPLAVTTRLYEAIRAHRAPGPPDAVTLQHAAEKPRERDALQEVSESSQSVSPLQPQRRVAPLIGRDEAWATALRVYEQSAHGAQALIIEGEAGIGKTRLADEVIAHARRQGSVVGVARCYQGESGLAYTPMAALLRSVVGDRAESRLRELPDIWLSEASRLAPELAAARPGLPAPPPLENPGAQSRFFEGLRETLIAACATGTPPGLLVLDDAQWADDATLDALMYLARRLERQPICLMVTWRSDAANTRRRLREWLAEALRRERATHIMLGRLAQNDIRTWLRHDLGDDATHPADLAARVYQETEGLPFFIAQYVMALSSGAVSMSGDEWVAPVGVHDLLRSRVSALSETGWQTLTAAATLGRSFDLDTLREVSGRSEEETTVALDELLALGIIREAPDTRQGDVSYDFTHDKLRAFAYDETSLARRRLLHRRAAEALVAMSRRQHEGAERAAEIAEHYAAAGDHANAAAQHVIAGARARELYAHADAIRHFQRALDLGYPDAAELHEAIGDAYTLQGDYTQALASYVEAAGLTQGPRLARILHRTGAVHARRGEWELAAQRFGAAIAAFDQSAASDPSSLGEQARIYADWSLTVRHLGQPEQARAYAQRALSMATAASDHHALAQAHNILGALANSQGDAALALSHLEESLKLAERLDDATARAAALNNLALALQAMGQVERALPMAEAALALTVAQGDRHHEAALHNNVADLLHASGHLEDAMAHLKQAVGIYAEIGVEAGAVQPGIWKMVDW